MKEIGIINFLHGWVPKSLKYWQDNSLQRGQSHSTGSNFITQLIYSLLRAKRRLWNLRCEIVHDKASGGLYLEEERELKRLIQTELRKETLGMEKNFNLMEYSEDDLFKKPIDAVRGWLINVYIARGELAKAGAERKRIRIGPCGISGCSTK